MSPPKTSPAPLGPTARLYHRTALTDNRSLAAALRSAARVHRREEGAKKAESLTGLACGEKAPASFARQAGSATRHATLGSFLGIRPARTRPVEWSVGSRVEMMRRITPVIMCGGAGTRLWPSSRESFPKQFIPFFGPRSSFQETVLRVSDPSLFGEPVIITGRGYSHLVADQLESVGAHGHDSARADAPRLRTGDRRRRELRSQTRPGVDAPRHGGRPRHPGRSGLPRRGPQRRRRSGRGLPDAVRHQAGPRRRPATATSGRARPGSGKAASRSKPSSRSPTLETAEAYVADGYLWNSGNFIFDPEVLLAEYRKFDAATVEAAERAVERATTGPWPYRPCRRRVRRLRRAVDRFRRHGAVRPACGSFPSPWTGPTSAAGPRSGNSRTRIGTAMPGRTAAVFLDARNNLVLADDLVCLVGVDNLGGGRRRETPFSSSTGARATPSRSWWRA